MANDKYMRIFHVDDGETIQSYHVRDSRINIGYGECSTVAATAAKSVTLTNDNGWRLTTGSTVVVKFTYAVPENATLNVGGTGAKNIYFRGAAITASVIAAGDIVTFMYDGTRYIVTAIDRVSSDINNKADKSSTVSSVDYDTTDNKITKTINGTTSVVVSASTLKSAMSLNNVENKSSATIRSEMTSSNVTTALGYTPLNSNLKGANGGLAELDNSGKVPSSQLPSYVDDILEYSGYSQFPQTGESGKIYVDASTCITYRWSGSAYIPISNPVNAMTGADGTNSGSSGLVPAPVATDNTKFLKGDGTWSNTPGSIVMTGATSTDPGASGLVPAPAAGDHGKVLYGDGGWDVAPGARVIQVETTVTNTSGAYSNTIADDRVTADMKPLSLEIATPSIFDDKITVTCGNGTVTIACSSVAGSSTVKINVIKAALNTSSVTTEEFDILNAGKVDKNQGSANAGKLLCVNSSGQVSLKDDEGSRFVVVDLDTVSNTSGSYTHTTSVSGMTGDLKAALIEAGDPTIFKAPVSIVTGTNSVTLSCSSVEGQSTVKVSFLAVGNDNPLSSTEYGALDTRIGSLSNLNTTDKTSIVNSINEQVGKVGNVPSGKTVQGEIETLNDNLTNLTDIMATKGRIVSLTQTFSEITIGSGFYNGGIFLTSFSGYNPNKHTPISVVLDDWGSMTNPISFIVSVLNGKIYPIGPENAKISSCVLRLVCFTTE